MTTRPVGGFTRREHPVLRMRPTVRFALAIVLTRLHPVPHRSRSSVEMTERRRIGSGCWLNDADAG